MYVCICLAVTDREVTEAIDRGADSIAAVTRACGAGGDCGACHETIQQIIDAGRDAAAGPVKRLPVVNERAA
jgi:bacterioferritin-associated ferredoxin